MSEIMSEMSEAIRRFGEAKAPLWVLLVIVAFLLLPMFALWRLKKHSAVRASVAMEKYVMLETNVYHARNCLCMLIRIVDRAAGRNTHLRVSMTGVDFAITDEGFIVAVEVTMTGLGDKVRTLVIQSVAYDKVVLVTGAATLLDREGGARQTLKVGHHGVGYADLDNDAWTALNSALNRVR